MIRRNKTILKLAAIALSLGVMVSIPQAAFASQYSDKYVDYFANYNIAKDKNGNEWGYCKKDDGTVAIIEARDMGEALVFPSELDGYKVSDINSLYQGVEGAYVSKYKNEAKKVKSIIIPEGITKIIGLDICENAETISIPSSINIIWRESLPEKWLDSNRDADGFVIKQGILIDGNKANGDITIPSGVRCIANGAFNYSWKHGNKDITSVIIPSSVKRIGISSFAYCTNLTKVIMQDGLEVIGDKAFKECTKLKEAKVPSTVTDLGSDVFEDSGLSGDSSNDKNDKEENDSDTSNTDTWEGWFPKDNGWYYKNADGSLKKGWFKHIDGIWYHTDLQTGKMTLGWFKDINGKWYYFDTHGARQSGWFRDNDGTWYHLKDDGEMSIGWFKDTNGKWYYFNSNGSRRSGWLQDYDGTWYYLKADGEMATGWIQDTDGKWYYLYSNGSMACNAYIGSYYVGRSGAWVR